MADLTVPPTGAEQPHASPISAPDAYQLVLPEIMAFPEDELVHINLDVPLVVTTILGTLPEMRALRSHLTAALTHFDVERFDKLELYTRATSHAHARYVAAKRPVLTFPELVEQGTKLRDTLHVDAQALVTRGLLDAAIIRDVKRANGHRPLGVDLQVLAVGLQDNWAAIASKTAVTTDDINRAIYLADRLQDAVGLRAEGAESVAETTIIRHRAYSLLVSVYEEVRDAIAYVRRKEQDLERIAPSIYVGRAPRRRPGEAEANSPVPAAQPAAAPASGSAETAPPVNPIPVGLPGSHPFARA